MMTRVLFSPDIPSLSLVSNVTLPLTGLWINSSFFPGRFYQKVIMESVCLQRLCAWDAWSLVWQGGEAIRLERGPVHWKGIQRMDILDVMKVAPWGSTLSLRSSITKARLCYLALAPWPPMSWISHSFQDSCHCNFIYHKVLTRV